MVDTLTIGLDTAKQPTLGTRDAPLNGTSYLWMMIGMSPPFHLEK